jgi:Cu(I)/Ag(I) efflux system periplasmic protein CusF
MPMKLLYSTLVAAAVALPAAAALAQHKHGPATTPPPAASQSRAEMADGEIRRVDKAKGTLLIRHGEIRSLNMSPMTMGFKLQDPKMADGLAPGDKIRFSVIQKGDDLIVTDLLKVQ